MACKKHLQSLVVPAMKPIQERRASLTAQDARTALEKGTERARAAARATLDEAYKAAGLR